MRVKVVLAAIVLAVASLALFSGCASMHQYTMQVAQDGSRAWIIESTSTATDPVVFECCDSCGKNGHPICWEAAMTDIQVPPTTPPPAESK